MTTFDITKITPDHSYRSYQILKNGKILVFEFRGKQTAYFYGTYQDVVKKADELNADQIEDLADFKTTGYRGKK